MYSNIWKMLNVKPVTEILKNALISISGRF